MFPSGAKVGQVSYSPLYMGCLWSLGFLSCGRNPLCSTSVSPLCVTSTGTGRLGPEVREASAARWDMGNKLLWSLTPMSHGSCLLPASMNLWQVTCQPARRIRCWLLHSFWQALATQVLEVNGVREEELSLKTPAHLVHTLNLGCALEPPGRFDQTQIPVLPARVSHSEGLRWVWGSMFLRSSQGTPLLLVVKRTCLENHLPKKDQIWIFYSHPQALYVWQTRWLFSAPTQQFGFFFPLNLQYVAVWN